MTSAKAQRQIVQWSEERPREVLGGEALAWHERGVRFFETLWTDPARRVHYCSALAQIERHTLRYDAVVPEHLDEDSCEAISELCLNLGCDSETYTLGGADVPSGLTITFDVDVNDDDVAEELNANHRDTTHLCA